MRSPPGRGSGCEKPVTPRWVPKQGHLGPARCENPFGNMESVTQKMFMPRNQKFYFWELFRKN